MGKVHDAVAGRLREFIEAQHVFFVATAPDLLQRYFERKGVEGAADYRRRKNRASLDGLRGYDDDPIGSEVDAALRAAW